MLLSSNNIYTNASFRQPLSTPADVESCNNHFFKELFSPPPGKRGVDGRLSSAQAALMLQEETIHKAERERQESAEQVASLEHNLHVCQEKNRELQVSANTITCHMTENPSLP